MGIGDLASAVGGALGIGGASEKPVEGVAPGVQRTIKVGGVELKPEIDSQIETVVVYDRLRMPDSFAITFRDPQHNIVSKARLKVGSEITIESGAPGAEKPDELMFGEVTSIETDYDRLGSRAVVRGYDAFHRLSAGTKSRTFTNVTYSDIVRKIARESSLSVDLDMTSGTLEYVIQPNVSDLHFLYYLAGRCGYSLSVKKKKLSFKAPTEASEAPALGKPDSQNPLQLVWGQRLLEFRARMSAAGQVAEVNVRGWDPKQQKAIIGKATGGTKSAKVSTDVKKLASTSTGKMYTVVDQPMASQAHAGHLAEAVAEQIGSAAYEATALVVGSPKLKSGVAVSIAKVDPALEGKWVITSARHEFGNGPYRTFLEFSGRQDRSLLGLAGGGGSQESGRPEFPGVVTAVVTDIEDPDKLGRVKVQYHWLGENMVSFWARVARPSAGKDYGVVWFPDTGEEVVVAFEHGDVNFPIVIGSLWNAKAKPPATWAGKVDKGKFMFHGLASPLGHKIMMNDDSKEGTGISIKTADDNLVIVLDQKEKTLEIKVVSGKELSIISKGDLKLTADGEITIDSKKKVNIKGQSGVDIAASTGNTTIKGTKVAIN
jgi:uncharacterized protein involved in type VI secretion and phage assembly